MLLTKQKANRAIWGISCTFHCTSAYGCDENSLMLQVPMNSGNTIAVAFASFMEKLEAKVWLDEAEWP